MFYINGILGSMGTILVLEYLEKWWKMTYLEFAGKNSLIIMATHGTLGFKVLVIKGWKAIYTLSETAGPRYYLECTGHSGRADAHRMRCSFHYQSIFSMAYRKI